MTNKITKKIFRSTIKAVDFDNYTVDAIISTSDIDRYGEVIALSAWQNGGLDNYKRHPVLLSSHDYNKLTRQIGVATAIGVENGQLTASFKYFVGEGNPEADWGFKLASKGYAAFSVGFIPKETSRAISFETPDITQTYTDVELVEVSQVLVPANPAALLKSQGDTQIGLESDDPIIKELTAMVQKNLIEKDESIVKKDMHDKMDSLHDKLDSYMGEYGKQIDSLHKKMDALHEKTDGLHKKADYLDDMSEAHMEKINTLHTKVDSLHDRLDDFKPSTECFPSKGPKSPDGPINDLMAIKAEIEIFNKEFSFPCN